MTPERFTEQLHRACQDNLTSVILFGSSAAGDHLGRQSDYNTLVVVKRLGLPELAALAPVARAWVRRGNPPPLCFTQESLERSADTFPLELLDIRDHHRILAGEDVISRLAVRPDHVRHQLEYELKGKLMQLRSRYLLSAGRPSQLRQLMTRSLSTFLVLFRGALRLHQPTVPAAKLEALRQLAALTQVDVSAIETVARLKAGARVPGVVMERLFADYLAAIELLVVSVDRFLSSGK